MIPATWLLSATRLAAARGDAAMSAHLSQQLGGAEREPPAWLVHEIARRSRLPRPDDPAARAREGGAFLATSRRSSGAASARPVVLHFYSLACRRCRRRRRGNDRFPSRSEKQLVVSRDRIDLCSQAAWRQRGRAAEARLGQAAAMAEEEDDLPPFKFVFNPRSILKLRKVRES
jgi:hypothetical protein